MKLLYLPFRTAYITSLVCWLFTYSVKQRLVAKILSKSPQSANYQAGVQSNWYARVG